MRRESAGGSTLRAAVPPSSVDASTPPGIGVRHPPTWEVWVGMKRSVRPEGAGPDAGAPPAATGAPRTSLGTRGYGDHSWAAKFLSPEADEGGRPQRLPLNLEVS